MSRTPCIVITRDQVSLTRACVASLERYADRLDIHLVDHGSSYPPMLDYLRHSSHPVHFSGDRPPRELWSSGVLGTIVGNQPYLVTDHDLVLDDACPTDWLDQLRAELLASPVSVAKIGLGLRIDDLPDTPLAAKVRAWECLFWTSLNDAGTAYRAPVDTTLALYPPLGRQPGFVLAPALRLAAPYLTRHLPWYGDDYPEETEHYRTHAIAGSSHWINGGW